MDVEHEERPAGNAFNLCHEDRPVKQDGLVGRGRDRSHTSVGYGWQIRVPQRPV